MASARVMFDAVDTFGGPGGWAEACRLLGLTEVGLEWDEAACQTRRAAGHLAIRADVAEYPTAPFVGKVRGKISSPPCQAWSMAGQRKGELDRLRCHELADAMALGSDAGIREWQWEDERSPLVCQPVRWVRDIRPEWIALEQVPPVLGLWQHFARIFRNWGYSTWTGVLNAADYGVPQTRERAILIASRVRKVQPPEPTHAKDGGHADLFGPGLLPWVTMADALGWGMNARPCVTVTAGSGRQGGPDPLDGGSGARETLRRERREGRWVTGMLGAGEAATRTAGQRPRSLDQPAHTVTGGGTGWWVTTSENGRQQSPGFDATERPARTVTGHDLGKHGWFYDRPATTIVGSFRPEIVSPPGYRTAESRQNAEGGVRVTVAEGGVRVTVAEGGVLQSFRADYPWQGSKTKQYQQVGNAIPPLLAAHVLSAVTGLPLTHEVAA